MRTIILSLLFIGFGFVLAPAQQTWSKKELSNQQKQEGLIELQTISLPSAVGYVVLGPGSDIAIGVKLLTKQNLSVVDSVHCNYEGKKLVVLDELFSARTEGGQGPQVKVSYRPLVAMMVGHAITPALALGISQCYDLYEEREYKRILEHDKLWQSEDLSPEEKKQYAYKFVSPRMQVFMSRDQESIKVVATENSLTHLIELIGKYEPQVAKEDWAGDIRANTVKKDLIRRHQNWEVSLFLPATIQRVARLLRK